MIPNDDIRQLLESCNADIQKISNQAKDGDISKVTLKNTLENLRSILDYLAQDILRKLQTYPNYKALPAKVYFPYGQHENHFKNSVNKNLPNLKSFDPKIFNLIESIQPFKSKNNWVVDLCLLTNDAKHNNLSKTENQKSFSVEQKGLVRIQNANNIVMHNNYVNGVRQDDVFISNQEVHVVKHSGTTEVILNNKIKFLGKEVEIAPFLNHCYTEIKVLVTRIEALP